LKLFIDKEKNSYKIGMRVISGKARGSKLSTIESQLTRPTLDRVKESLFNIIQSRISESQVLDLFAGSGALGIEALSRGAKGATFCDNNPEAIKVIKNNLTKTRFIEHAKVINADYSKCLEILKRENETFDIIFIDPPYKMDIAVKSIKIILDNQLLKKDGLIVLETDEAERDLKELEELEKNDSIHITDQRKYGRANLIFIGV